MGTSEEVLSEHQRQRLHTQYPHHQFAPMTPPPNQGGQRFHSPHASAPAGPQSSASWPHEKLSKSDVAHTDPSQDGNQNDEPMSPSPTNYGSSASVFHFGEPSPTQCNSTNNASSYAGMVATPITRFLTKQTFGYIPKPSFPSATDGVVSPSPPPTANSKIPSLRLPSLSASGSLSHSPLPSPQGSFSLPVGETLSRLFNSASLGNNSAPSSPLPPPRSNSGAVTLPPLKRACLSPTPTTLPSLAHRLSLEDICKPFRYQRSMSCPSDAMARPAVMEQHEPEAQIVPPVLLQPTDVRKYRVERSNSVDAGAVLAMRDARQRALYSGEKRSHESSEDFHDWLERPQSDCHPLASLAESAHAMQRLEQSRSTDLDSPRSITSASGSGDESMNPFDASESGELRREKKLCAFPHCASNAVTRGLCISHGGGRRCQRKGCTRGAQSKGLCVAHGGGRICKSKGCSNIQRSMGLCIRHGGGKRCSVSGCQKGVVRQDLCTAHGGKRKCKVEDCNKHVKKKGLCRSHANSVLGASAMSSPSEAMSPEYSN